MKLAVKTLEGKDVEDITLAEAIFGLEPREDILQRVVRWQLAKRRAGTHAVKNRADIHRTGKKMYKQKGTGRARHSSARAPQFRGGGRAFGPVVRSHAHDLPKKLRQLGLKHALSAKAQAETLLVLDSASLKESKTKLLLKHLATLGLTNALFIDGAAVDEAFANAAHNIAHIDVLPVQGINVYDILRHDHLVLTKAALAALEERFA